MLNNDIKLDTQRQERKGYCEAIYCKCKTNEQLIHIFQKFKNNKQNAIGTKANLKQFEALKKRFKNIEYNKTAQIITLIQNKTKKIGEIAICTGGAGDIPIAEEASAVAEFYGSNVKKYYDIGIAGIHRLFENIENIKKQMS